MLMCLLCASGSPPDALRSVSAKPPYTLTPLLKRDPPAVAIAHPDLIAARRLVDPRVANPHFSLPQSPLSTQREWLAVFSSLLEMLSRDPKTIGLARKQSVIGTRLRLAR